MSSMALSFLFLSLSWGAQFIGTTESFSLSVPAPSVIFECQDKVFVYSKENKDLTAFSSTDGKIIEKHPLPSLKDYFMTAGSCFNQKAILAFSSSKKNRFVFLNSQTKINSPESGWVTDLKCEKQNCWTVVSGKVFKTSDFTHWVQIPIRKTSEIQSKEIDTSTNPFDDWQEKLLLTQGLVTKVAPLKDDRFALLDPLRASIIISKKNNEYERWGRFGTWEGYLLSPKGFAVIDNKYFMILDTALKVISVFDINGTYLGVLSLEKNLLSLLYPSHISVVGKRIFVSDLFANKVWALELSLSSYFNNLRETKDLVRVNLYRREEVLKDRIRNRCLLCHDGTIRDDSDKYIHENFNHPIKVEIKTKTDLPLTEGNLITCSTCHDPHHGATMAKGSVSLKRPFLRKSKEDLCLTCHEKESDPKMNHKGHKNNACTECHTPHGGAEKALKQTTPALCLKCHSLRGFEHGNISHLLSTQRAKETRTVDGKISCITCHAPHGTSSAEGSMRPTEELTGFCASCHDEKAVSLIKNFHKRVWKK